MLNAALVGALTQTSLLLTALFVYWRTIPPKVVGQMAGLGAGALLGAAAFELVPEAQATLGGAQIGVWLLAGGCVFMIADRIIERRFGESGAMGIVVGNVNDALPESLIFGIQIGAGLATSPALAVSVWVSNIPQALPPAADLRTQGWGRGRQSALWGSVVVAAGVLSAVGYALTQSISDVNGARVAAFTIGGLITMLTTSMIPFAYSKGGKAAGLWAVVGFGLTLATA